MDIVATRWVVTISGIREGRTFRLVSCLVVCVVGFIGSKVLGGFGKSGGFATWVGLRVLESGLASMLVALAFSYILAREKAFITKVGWNILTII